MGQGSYTSIFRSAKLTNHTKTPKCSIRSPQITDQLSFHRQKNKTPTRFSHRSEFGPGFRILIKSWNYIVWNRLIIRDRKITYRFDFLAQKRDVSSMNETKITELHTRLCETSCECVAKVTTGFSPRYFKHNNNFTRLRTRDWIIL